MEGGDNKGGGVFGRPAEGGVNCEIQLTDKPPVSAEKPLPQKTSRPPVRLSVIGRFAGYGIMGRLALGGMAEILLAQHNDPDGSKRYIVVKKILPHFKTDNEFVQMFLDEARLGMMLDHPHICRFFQFGEQDGAHFMTMEWVNGMPLGRVIRRAHKYAGISIPVAVRMISNIASALHYAHNITDEHGEAVKLIHRDVSPHNIMVSYDGETKLLDFGIAKAEQQAHRTQAGVVKGKFAYMSPEQCVGGDMDHRLDVFALGVCLYETVAGKSLYRRKSEAATMRAIIMDPVPSLKERLPDIPPALDAIVQKSLAKEVGDRYQSAGEMHNDLEAFLQSTGASVSKRELSAFMRQIFAEEFGVGPRVDPVAVGTLGNQNIEIDAQSANVVSLVSGTRELELEPELEGNNLGDLMGNGGFSLDQELQFASMRPPEPVANQAPPMPLTLDIDTPQKVLPAVKTKKAPGERAASKAKKTSNTRGWLPVVLALSVAGLLGLLGYLANTNKEIGTTPKALLVERPVPKGNRLQVASAPAGASVYLDAQLRGVTPFDASNVEAGKHELRVEYVGFAPWSKTIEVDAEKPTRQLIRLVPKFGGEPGVTGTLSLKTNPPAVVFLDGEKLGPTPLRRVRLPSGRLPLLFEMADGSRMIRDVTVKAHELVDIEIKLMLDF